MFARILSQSFARVGCLAPHRSIANAVRVRFAPSPTGFVHLGGLRTALFNYLVAKKHNGKFLLRIEDTDQSRLVPGSVESIIDTLQWAGIPFDEGPGREGGCGPYVQSQRLSLYHNHAEQLVQNGKAFRCFCSSARLESLRLSAQQSGLPSKYDGRCHSLTKDEIALKLSRGDPHTIRMALPSGQGVVAVTDSIHGTVTFNLDTLDESVLLKSDGFPTYHLANVVDDHMMEISHVIRGEEWLPSTPKHVLLYRAFGWEPPIFAHLPLLTNMDGTKLSKRQNHASVSGYRDGGYLPEALINFVAFLGWNPKDAREVFTLEELVQSFDLSACQISSAAVNVQKLQWLNQQHLRKMIAEPASLQRLVDCVRPQVQQLAPSKSFSDAYIGRVLHTMRDRLVLITDFGEQCTYFFADVPVVVLSEQERTVVNRTLAALQTLQDSDFVPERLTVLLETMRKENKLKPKELFMPLRMSLSGVSAGAPIPDIIATLGPEVAKKRLELACRSC
eukprot:TRINITY_DN10611_c0_g1_i1.p1 TRINITY_DN10611_c0_g1~~TRINITY_DN10611_c0_g1_i1.p1  ORF type:complete len:504 (-),score=74.64 TRINITY_DN10611_c0_g1_i1:13-1524(-)